MTIHRDDWMRITALEAAARLWANDKGVDTKRVQSTADELLLWLQPPGDQPDVWVAKDINWPEPAARKTPELQRSTKPVDPPPVAAGLRARHLTFWAYDNARDSQHGATIFARRLVRGGPKLEYVGQRVAVWINSTVGWLDSTGTMGRIDFDHEANRPEPSFRQIIVKQLHALGVSLPSADHDLFTQD